MRCSPVLGWGKARWAATAIAGERLPGGAHVVMAEGQEAAGRARIQHARAVEEGETALGQGGLVAGVKCSVTEAGDHVLHKGGAPRHLWRSPLLILPLIHSPHGAFDVLHTHKALVQAEVVPHGILPGGSVSPEIGEHPGEPVIDLIQGELPVRSFQNGLADEGGIGEGGPDVRILVKLMILSQL